MSIPHHPFDILFYFLIVIFTRFLLIFHGHHFPHTHAARGGVAIERGAVNEDQFVVLVGACGLSIEFNARV